jgi:hypothetical protein
MISTRAIPDGAINTAKLSTTLKSGVYTNKIFNDHPLVAVNTAPSYLSNPTGTGGDLNLARWITAQGVLSALIHIKGTQTLLTPLLDTAEGLDISQDQTDNDGVEYVFGGHLGVLNPYAVTVGTTANTFARLKITIADVTGTDDCAFGFRKLEACQANIDDYDEAAYLNVILGNIKTETILNGAGTAVSATLTTCADAATKDLKVEIVGRKVRFYVNGIKYGPSFSFDAGEVVVPFFFFLQATTTPGKVFFKEFEFGRLTDVDSEGMGV